MAAPSRAKVRASLASSRLSLHLLSDAAARFADHLRRHSANHDPGRARHCPDCGRGFARPGALALLARRSCATSPRSSCPDKASLHADVLAAHVRKHEQDAATSGRPSAPLVDPGLSASGLVCDDLESTVLAEPTLKIDEVDECAVEDLEALYAWLMNGSSDLAPPTTVGLDDVALYASFDSLVDVEVSKTTSRAEHVLPEPPPSLPLSQTRLFAVDETLRSRLLAFLFVRPTLSPLHPHETDLLVQQALPELANSTSFTCDALSTALERYWAGFAPTFPLLHAPTFDPHASTGLLASLVVVGMCVSDEKAAYDLGASIFSKMRPLLLLVCLSLSCSPSCSTVRDLTRRSCPTARGLGPGRPARDLSGARHPRARRPDAFRHPTARPLVLSGSSRLRHQSQYGHLVPSVVQALQLVERIGRGTMASLGLERVVVPALLRRHASRCASTFSFSSRAIETED